MTKHFSGGGPQKDGEDAHFPYGADQVYPGDNFDYHLIPFEKGAFAANTAQIMPYYGVPIGQTSEDVAFGFNKDIITDLLRDTYGFDGVACTDWGLVTESRFKPAAAWGVEHLNEEERVGKIFDAGCDMLGGEACPQHIFSLVEKGALKEARLDASVKRVLRDKFTLGLFDNPYLETDDLSIVGTASFVEKGRESQRRSLVLLKNEGNILPLHPNVKVYAQGLDKEALTQLDNVVSDPKDADYIVLKIGTPFEPRSEYILERFFNQGRLDFTEKEKAELLKIIESKPTITVVTLDRPAVIPDINEASKAVLADFHCEDDIIMESVFGKFKPSGKLPFEMPSSMEAVKNQKEDVPYDSENPLYDFGHWLTY